MTIFIGDVHGSSTVLGEIFLRRGTEKEFIQVGDFGIAFPHNSNAWDFLRRKLDQPQMSEVQFYIVPGNHDNWDFIYDSLNLQPGEIVTLGKNQNLHICGVGSTLRDYLFVGGAPSIDFDVRTPGVSWWHRECITLEEEAYLRNNASRFAGKYTLVSHMSPSPDLIKISDARSLRSELGYADDGMSAQTYVIPENRRFDKLVDLLMPNIIIHGHHHLSYGGSYFSNDFDVPIIPTRGLAGAFQNNFEMSKLTFRV
jgi:hypothetical protein